MVEMHRNDGECVVPGETPEDFSAQALQLYLSKIELSWNRWIAALDQLDDDQIVASGTCGDWSVKDMIGHVAVWDEVAIEKTESILSSANRQPPAESLDAFNDRTWKAFRDRSLSDLKDWMVETHARMIVAIRNAIGATNEQRERLEYATVDDTWKHYDTHREQVVARFGVSA